MQARPRPFTSKCPQIVKFNSHYAIHSSLSSPEAPVSSITMPTSHTHLLYLNITEISHELLKPRWKFQLPTMQVGTYSLTMSTIEIASRFGRTFAVSISGTEEPPSQLSVYAQCWVRNPQYTNILCSLIIPEGVLSFPRHVVSPNCRNDTC
jgi:hypothetical protein